MDLFSIPFLATFFAIVISWALFAMACSFVHEMIAQILAERGRFMKKYLFRQLEDTPNGINWASLLYMQGPIELLSRADNKPTSDIEPKLFATSLIESVANSQIVKLHAPELRNIDDNPQFVDDRNDYRNLTLYNFKAATQVLKPSDVIEMFRQAMRAAELNTPEPNGETENVVYQNLVSHLENWYKEFTERLTLWYKKKTRVRLFLLGIVLAVLVNVDSIQLFKFFNEHPDSRTAVLSFYEQKKDEYNTKAIRLQHGEVDSTNKLPVDSIIKIGQSFEKDIDSLRKAAAIPVGFDHNVFRSPSHGGDIWWKILGLLISGFAASFGAPFWFDLLRRATSAKT
jgi:hypothetical protein